MNRKLLNFILSGALLFSCVGFMSSCKDTSEDQFAETKGEILSLEDQLKKATAQVDALQAQLDKLEGKVNDHLANHPSGGTGCTCDLSGILADIANIQATLTNSKLEENAALVASLPTTLLDLETRLQEAEAALEGLVEDPRLKPLLDITDVENLEKVLKAYEFTTLPQALEQLLKDVADLKAQKIPADLTEKVDGLEQRIDALATALDLKVDQEDLDAAVTAINQTIDQKADALQQQIDALVVELAKKADKADLDALTLTVSQLNQTLTEILEADYQGQIDAINNQLQELESIKAEIANLKKLEDRLNNIINSIVVQQVTNKVFGSLFLPLGIQTNILMAYHGYNTKDIETFPSSSTRYEYNGGQAFKSSELTGVDKYNVGVVLIDESENNAGNIYFTVNPSNVNLKGSVFTLVNSLDYGCGIDLSAPVACDKMLMFGWSRADNGFYVSNAHLAEANIEKCNITLGGELKHEIKETAKQFLHDLRHLDRPDISQIATTIKNVLQRFNGQFPAMGIKGQYSYTDLEGNDVTAATYSNYGVAAATFEPLSFSFLEGQDNKFDKLPSIPTIDNFEFEMSEIKLNFNKKLDIKDIDINVSFEEITFNPDDLSFSGYIEIEGEKYYIQDAEVQGLDKIAQTINDKLEEVIGLVTDDVTAQVNDMVAEINQQIEEMLDDMSAEVNQQLNDILSDLSDDVNGQLDKYTNRINDLIKKANKLIARVNNVLAHPNKYLQPLGIYSASNGQDMHVLSTSIVAPSRFYMKGGNATTLYFTSYTLETIAPSFKKFVKVVNAWKNGDTSRTNVASVVNNANAQGSLNKVVNGDQIRFAFAPEAGYTYEIVFQALDYQGITSTRRCFIEVR